MKAMEAGETRVSASGVLLIFQINDTNNPLEAIKWRCRSACQADRVAS